MLSRPTSLKRSLEVASPRSLALRHPKTERQRLVTFANILAKDGQHLRTFWVWSCAKKKCADLLDLKHCRKIIIRLQKSAFIQPRTSPPQVYVANCWHSIFFNFHLPQGFNFRRPATPAAGHAAGTGSFWDTVRFIVLVRCCVIRGTSRVEGASRTAQPAAAAQQENVFLRAEVRTRSPNPGPGRRRSSSGRSSSARRWRSGAYPLYAADKLKSNGFFNNFFKHFCPPLQLSINPNCFQTFLSPSQLSIKPLKIVENPSQHAASNRRLFSKFPFEFSKNSFGISIVFVWNFKYSVRNFKLSVRNFKCSVRTSNISGLNITFFVYNFSFFVRNFIFARS